MRYVFVDIDELIGYDEKSEEEAISKNVLKMLKKIIQKTSCRLVITSKCRREFWTEKYDLLSPHVRNVVDSMAKYNIDVFSITPSKEDVPNYSKQDSIISWLSKSYVDNDKFVILGFNPDEFKCFEKEFIQIPKDKKISLSVYLKICRNLR